jgi:hypothetical protein
MRRKIRFSPTQVFRQFVIGIITGGFIGAISFLVLFHREWADNITGLATIALTLVTIVLAAYTAVLANDARLATQLTDRHHQESLNPFLTLESIQFCDEPNLHVEARIRNVGLASAIVVQYNAEINRTFKYPDPNLHMGPRRIGAISVNTAVTISFPIDPASGVDRAATIDRCFLAIAYMNMFMSWGELVIIANNVKKTQIIQGEAPPAVARPLLEANAPKGQRP